MKQQLVSPHTTLDGSLVQANASHKSFVPMEVFLKPEEYTQRIRSWDPGQDQDPGNPTITFQGERRSNQTWVRTRDILPNFFWSRSFGGASPRTLRPK